MNFLENYNYCDSCSKISEYLQRLVKWISRKTFRS